MPMTVKGMRQLRRDIRRLQPRIAQGIFAEGTAAMAKTIAETMRGTVAFSDQSGALRRSIRSGARDYKYRLYGRVMRIKGGLGVAAAGAKGTGVAYAAAVEYGKKSDSPRRERPFAREAADTGGRAAARSGYEAMRAAFRRNFGDDGRG